MRLFDRSRLNQDYRSTSLDHRRAKSSLWTSPMYHPYMSQWFIRSSQPLLRCRIDRQSFTVFGSIQTSVNRAEQFIINWSHLFIRHQVHLKQTWRVSPISCCTPWPLDRRGNRNSGCWPSAWSNKGLLGPGQWSPVKFQSLSVELKVQFPSMNSEWQRSAPQMLKSLSLGGSFLPRERIPPWRPILWRKALM